MEVQEKILISFRLTTIQSVKVSVNSLYSVLGANTFVASIDGSRGRERMRAPPPRGPNSFIFIQFSAK